ncbi:MAG: PIN domain-containing protein [Armatimonadetes bacterium]|nr:PIN domain-containing protein [Armatimonadota bacterium]
MANKDLLDAHTLLWYLVRDARLGAGAKRLLDDPTRELVLPIIALAEAAFTVESGRKTVITSVGDLKRNVLADPRIEVYPLTLDIFQRSLSLTSIPEMHDRLIVATALHLQDQGHSVSLLTKDAAITQSGLAPVVW